MKLKNLLIVIGIIALVGLGVALYQTSQEDADIESTNGEVAQEISVSTTIQNGEDLRTFETSHSTDTSAMSVLESIASDEGLALETTEYDFGSVVDSIDGIGEDTTDNKYWIYYINDETAIEGASAYIVQDGDVIRWNYEESIY